MRQHFRSQLQGVWVQPCNRAAQADMQCTQEEHRQVLWGAVEGGGVYLSMPHHPRGDHTAQRTSVSTNTHLQWDSWEAWKS